MKRTRFGFTLVELIIVIAVIGVLAAILIPVFSNVISKANQKSALSDARNTVEQYIIDAMENANMPKDIVIFVEKGGEIYLFGYDTTRGGEIKVINDGCAVCDAQGEEPWRAMMKDFSFNVKCPGGIPDQEADYSDGTKGIFWMDPYTEVNGEMEPAVKGFHAAKDDPESVYVRYTDNGIDETYRVLSREMSEKMGEEGKLAVFHAVLLPGTFTIENSSGGGTPGGDPVTPTPDPDPEPETPKFTVTFKEGSSTGSFNDGNVTVPASAEGLTSFTLTDTSAYKATYAADGGVDEYECVGWKYGEQTAGTIFATESLTSIEVEAVWVRKTSYKISFEADTAISYGTAPEGWSNGKAIASVDDIKTLVSTTTAADKTSKQIFLGWQVKNAESTIYTSANISSLGITGHTTFAAAYKDSFKVTLDPNGGKVGSHTAEYELGEYNTGDTYTLPTAQREGYDFDGWLLEGGSETPYTGDRTMGSANVKYTAKWTHKVSVKYFVDGAELTTGAYSGITARVGADYVVLGYSGSKTGYTFDGWTLNGTTGTVYGPGKTEKVTNVSGELKFYAKFVENTYEVTLLASPDGSARFSGVTFTSNYKFTYTYGTTVTVTCNPTTGYNFVKWNDNSTNATLTISNITENKTYTATCALKTYTVTFNANGGSVSPASATVEHGKTVTSLPTPTYSGYDFDGWYTAQTGGTQFTTSTAVTGNITVYAHWTAATSKYKLIFDCGTGGTFNPNGMSVNGVQNGTKYVITLDEGTDIAPYVNTVEATKSGYRFVAWQYTEGSNTSEFNSTPMYQLASVGIDEDVTFIAKFIDNGHAIYDQATLNKVGTNATTMSEDWYVVKDFALTTVHSMFSINNVSFTGTLYGNGHTISNFSINTPETVYAGIFDEIAEGGKVCDLNLNVTNINNGLCTGAISAFNCGEIINVHVNVSGSIYTKYYNDDDAAYTGGICGWNDGGTIAYCSVKGTINGQNGDQNGGICGYSEGGQITKSWFKGTVTGNIGCSGLGGIVGATSSKAVIQDCWAYVDSLVGDDYLGGILGIDFGGTKVINCWAAVKDYYCRQVALAYAGNAVAAVTASSNYSTVTNCYYLSGASFYPGNEINWETGTALSDASLRTAYSRLGSAWDANLGYNGYAGIKLNPYK